MRVVIPYKPRMRGQWNTENASVISGDDAAEPTVAITAGNIRAHCRQPHTTISFLIFLRLKTIALSCYMRPRNDGEPKLEKL
jgi:hypothetical protein